ELVRRMKMQVEDLRKTGPPNELEKTIKDFSAFLDKMCENPENLKADVVRFVAFSYAGLERHDNAAELLKRIPKPPPSANPDKEKQDKENQDNEAFYNAARV